MVLKSLGFVTLAFAVALPAQTAANGIWTLPLGQRTLLVLTLQSASGNGGQQCSGSMARVKKMQTRNFTAFAQVSGPTIIEPIVSCTAKDGGLLLTLKNPADANDRDAFLFRVRDTEHAEMSVDGAPLPPMHLTRGHSASAVSTNWDAARTYTVEDDAPSNPQMKLIFDEDQRVRAAWPSIDWEATGKADAERRVQTRKLLQDGALHSGEDFWWAAHVFQHGNAPDDYLLAHTLSVIAVQKGYSAAVWLTAATLDRYLQAIKQPQIYGTQFSTPGSTPATQEPYNRTLISDALRRKMDVPTLAEQDEQRKKYDSDRKLALSTPAK